MANTRNFKRELWIGIMDLLQPSDRSLQEVLREMKDPLGSNGMMPPPLSAIYTPKVRRLKRSSFMKHFTLKRGL